MKPAAKKTKPLKTTPKTKSARPKRLVPRKSKTTKKASKKMSNIVTAYKAFNADMTCRDFKFEIGATYEHKGRVSICEGGFHACAVPFDCWSYYPDSHTFARVKMENPQGRNEEDSKLVTGRITIEASLNLPTWIKEQVAAIWAICRASSQPVTTGDHAHAASTGNYAHAASTGDGAHAASTGNYAHAASTGYRAHAASTGYRAHAASTGDGAHAASTGNYAHAASTGYRAHASALGSDACAATLGVEGRAAAGDNGAVIVAYRDDKDRQRVAVGYVGENGIKARTWYTSDHAGALIEQGPVS